MYNERICFTNNHNGRNYGGDGKISIVDDDGNTVEIINEDKSRIRWFLNATATAPGATQFTIHAFEPNIRRRTCDKK